MDGLTLLEIMEQAKQVVLVLPWLSLFLLPKHVGGFRWQHIPKAVKPGAGQVLTQLTDDVRPTTSTKLFPLLVALPIRPPSISGLPPPIPSSLQSHHGSLQDLELRSPCCRTCTLLVQELPEQKFHVLVLTLAQSANLRTQRLEPDILISNNS